MWPTTDDIDDICGNKLQQGSNSDSADCSSSPASKEVDRKIAEASTNLAKRLLSENVFNANISEFIDLLNLLEEAGYIKD